MWNISFQRIIVAWILLDCWIVWLWTRSTHVWRVIQVKGKEWFGHNACCDFDSRSWLAVFEATLCDQVFQWFAASVFQGTPVFFTNKTDTYTITEILCIMVLNTNSSYTLLYLSTISFSILFACSTDFSIHVCGFKHWWGQTKYLNWYFLLFH